MESRLVGTWVLTNKQWINYLIKKCCLAENEVNILSLNGNWKVSSQVWIYLLPLFHRKLFTTICFLKRKFIPLFLFRLYARIHFPFKLYILFITNESFSVFRFWNFSFLLVAIRVWHSLRETVIRLTISVFHSACWHCEVANEGVVGWLRVFWHTLYGVCSEIVDMILT